MIDKEFIEFVREQSKSRQGDIQYPYCTGYYESIIESLVRDVPGVKEYLEKYVQLALKNKVA